MTIRTRTSHRIWTGAPSTIQRAPSPLRTRGHRARGGEEKEIEVISTVKEVARAREPGRGHAPHWDDVLAGAVFQAQQKVDINGLVSFVKESGLRNREGEAGYVLKRLTGTAFEPGDLDSLKPELKDWYDEQLANMGEVLADAMREVEKRIRKLKARGDYTSADILRIKTSEYPNWSTQYIAASNKLHKVEAKGGPEAVATEQAKAFAKVRAETAGVDISDLSEKQIVSLKKASAEKAIEESLKLGLNAEQLMAIRATPKNKREAFTEAYGTREKGITIAPETVEKPVVTIEATRKEKRKAEDAKAEAKAQGWSCYTQLYTYKVALKDGSIVLVEAFDEVSAETKAKDAGYNVAWTTRMMSWETIEPIIEETSAYEVSFKDGTKIIMEPTTDPSTGEPTWSIPQLEKYKDDEGNYDLIRIVADKDISRSAIEYIFGEDTVKWAIGASEVLNKLKGYKTEDGYKLVEALTDKAISMDDAALIFDKDIVNEAMGAALLAAAPTVAEFEGQVSTVSGQRTATAAEQRAARETTYSAKDIGLMAADCLVPFVYVIRHWDDISTAEKALWIGLDIACFVAPFAAASIRGARGAVAAGRVARLAGAAKGVGRELVVMVKGPITTVMHPIATTRQALKDVRSILTNIFDPRKVSEAVLTTSEGTLRLKLTGATSIDDFMGARDKLIKLAARGERPIVQLKDKAGKVIASLELTKAPLMREVKGGVVHTTPWGRQFEDALTVRLKPGMGVSEQGLFVSHEPLPRFAKQSAFNMPIELGRISGSKQVLTTRIGYNQVVRINLDKKLSTEVLERLAKARLIETPGQDLTSLGARQIRGLVDALQSSGNIKAANALQQTADAYKPIFRIISPDKVDDLVGTGKVYRGAVELEAKLPVGARVEPPKQILYTHIGPEATRVEIWLDKPLSAKQILRLKAEGLAEVFKQPFRTPLKITPVKGAGLTEQQVKQLANILDAAGDPQVARSLQRAYQLSRSQARLAQVLARAGMGAIARMPGRVAARAPEVEYLAMARGVEALRESERPRVVGRAERGAEGRRAEGAERAKRAGRAERPERATRAERTERTKRTERRMRPGREERLERLERPERPVRTVRPIRGERPIKPTKPRIERVSTKLGRERIPRPGESLVSWRQGMYYITLVEPYRTTGTKPDVIYSRQRPPWGKVVKGKHSPGLSLKSIGRVPDTIKLPMGVVTARVKKGRRLSFMPD